MAGESEETALIGDLREVLLARRHLAVDAIVKAYVERAAGGHPVAAGARALELLRDHRRFDLVVELGEVLRARSDDASVRRLHAQGLIEQGHLTEAIASLKRGLDTALPRRERGEMHGLLGRAYKQLYIDARPNVAAPRRHDWRAALLHYRQAGADVGSRLWAGVNVLALLHHGLQFADAAERERIAARRNTLASTLWKSARETAHQDYWAAAVAIEAALPLPGCHESIPGLLRLFLQPPSGDPPPAFALRSFWRQLQAFWKLSPNDGPGAHILPALESALARAGALDRPLDGAHLQRVFGTEGYQPFEWYLAGMRLAAAVGRVGRSPYRGVGTCFLVAPDLVLTNWHVVPEALEPTDAWVSFSAIGAEGEVRRRGREIVWTSGDLDTDATVLRLDAPVDPGRQPPALRPAGERQVERGRRAYVIGHPEGAALAVSLHDSRIVGSSSEVLHYRTPTTHGSSGSPVFDEDWNVIGLHRAGHAWMRRLDGGGRYEANEATRINRILAACPLLGDPGPAPDLLPAPPAALQILRRTARRIVVLEQRAGDRVLDDVAGRLEGEVFRAGSVAEAVEGVLARLERSRLAELDIIGHASPGKLSLGAADGESDPLRLVSAAPDVIAALGPLRERFGPGAVLRLLGCSVAGERLGRLLAYTLSVALEVRVVGAVRPLIAAHFGADGYAGEDWRCIGVAGPEDGARLLSAGLESVPHYGRGLPPSRRRALPTVESVHARAISPGALGARSWPVTAGDFHGIVSCFDSGAFDAAGMLASPEIELRVSPVGRPEECWTVVCGGRGLVVPAEQGPQVWFSTEPVPWDGTLRSTT